MLCSIITFAFVWFTHLSAEADEAKGSPEHVKTLVSRLDLKRYKETLKGLAQFGDRREGTARNREAVDWIEAQLKSYGCDNTERIAYQFDPHQRRTPAKPEQFRPVIESGEIVLGPGGSRLRGVKAKIGANTNPMLQKNKKLRELNAEQSQPGLREEVYCTKIGTKHPDEMYIIGAHMDGIGFGEAVNDDGSGTALVMELARILSMPDVQTERSIRFVFFNSEEVGLIGSKAYVEQRAPLQGKEEPKGSGRFPEPKWLGMVQHDMMLWDHGMPRKNGTVSQRQRAEADINVEFQSKSKFANEAMKLAFLFRDANEKYASDYPAAVGHHMTNTDSAPFMDLVPSISVRENERGMHTQAGWNPTWHQPIDVFSTFSDDDFRLGLNAAQTTLGAILELAEATLLPMKKL